MLVSISNGRQRTSITLPMEDSKLMAVMRKIGVDEVIPYCKLLSVGSGSNLLNQSIGEIFDFNLLHPLNQCVGNMVNLDEVNFFVKRLESLTDYEKNVLQVIAVQRGIDSVKHLINLTYSMPGLSLITNLSDAEEVGKRLYMDKYQGLSLSEKRNIDFIVFAEKVLKEQQVTVMPHGVLVENGFEMQEVYNGKTFPEYIYDSGSIVATVEVTNVHGDKEYLYLPTDCCAWEKIKARLGVSVFTDCKITDISGITLPDFLTPSIEQVTSLKELNYFNEMCKAVRGFDETQMKKLEMAVKFAGGRNTRDVTYIAENLTDFEIHFSVADDKQYGEYLVKESGLYNADEKVHSYIDFVNLARDRRCNLLVHSGYMEEGFVGATKVTSDYLQYQGEFAEPLELDTSSCGVLCLYSPLYGQMNEDGEYSYDLYPSDLMQYMEEITEAIQNDFSPEEELQGMMRYFRGSKGIAGKILSAHPKVEEHQGELYGVLECRVTSSLTEQELEEFKAYWTGQMSDGWGEGFEQRELRTEDGEIYVSFWSSSHDWSIKTAEEMGIYPEQDMQMSV